MSWLWGSRKPQEPQFPQFPVPPTSGGGDDSGGSSEDKKRAMEAYRFSSPALQRAAQAARYLEKSRFAKEALDLSKSQEITRQTEFAVKVKEYEAHIEQSQVEQKLVEADERRKTLQEETKQHQARAQYLLRRFDGAGEDASLTEPWRYQATSPSMQPYHAVWGSGVADFLSLATRGNNMEKPPTKRWETASQRAKGVEHFLPEQAKSSHQPRSSRDQGGSRRKEKDSSTSPRSGADRTKTVDRMRERIDTRRKNRRDNNPPPPRGQPGGIDDPLRRGLSGAGVRWYLRYLDRGMAPEEARKKALEHKKLEENPPRTNVQVKRSNKDRTPQKESTAKRKRTDGPHTSNAVGQAATYADAMRVTNVAIVPKEYPKRILSPEELSKLEDALVEEMVPGTEYKLQFGGIRFKQGFLAVECLGVQTADWVKKKITNLKSWQGVELMACLGDDIPRVHYITIFFPRSAGQDAQKLMGLLDSQNEGLCTGLWKIQNSKKEGAGQLVKFSIDEKSCESIKKAGHSLYFRFGKITIHGLLGTGESLPVKLDP